MLIREACCAAFYCQRCGQIHVHEIPYFSDARKTVLRCGTCGHEQAVLERLNGGRISVELDCVVCGENNRFVFSLKRLHSVQLEKIYCRKDHFELGYIGCRKKIEELLSFNQAEFEALHPSDGKNFIEKQRVLLGVLNRVDEMASTGCISCSCGHSDISAELHGHYIVLSCANCGSCYTLRAEKASDLAHIGRYIELLVPGMAGDR